MTFIDDNHSMQDGMCGLCATFGIDYCADRLADEKAQVAEDSQAYAADLVAMREFLAFEGLALPDNPDWAGMTGREIIAHEFGEESAHE